MCELLLTADRQIECGGRAWLGTMNQYSGHMVCTPYAMVGVLRLTSRSTGRPIVSLR